MFLGVFWSRFVWLVSCWGTIFLSPAASCRSLCLEALISCKNVHKLRGHQLDRVETKTNLRLVIHLEMRAAGRGPVLSWNLTII